MVKKDVNKARKLTAMAVQKAYSEGFGNGQAYERGDVAGTWMSSESKKFHDQLMANITVENNEDTSDLSDDDKSSDPTG